MPQNSGAAEHREVANITLQELRSLLRDILLGAAAALGGPADAQPGWPSRALAAGSDHPAGRTVLTVAEVAETLGISIRSAYSHVAAGRLPAKRVGRRILVPVAALDRFLADGDAKSPLRESTAPEWRP